MQPVYSGLGSDEDAEIAAYYASPAVVEAAIRVDAFHFEWNNTPWDE